MSYQRCRIVRIWLLLLLATSPLLSADEKPTVNSPQKGTDLGNYVPTTTTWVVVSPTLPKYNGNNTCLAGVYRDKNVISIYAQNEDKHVWELLHAVDRDLQGHPEIKAYVVINKSLRDPSGGNLSAARFAETKELALAHKFRQVDVSLCRSTSKLLFDENTLVKFVYSQNRIVKMSIKFTKTDQPLKDAAALIETVLKFSAVR
jgi:hypothetical protein